MYIHRYYAAGLLAVCVLSALGAGILSAQDRAGAQQEEIAPGDTLALTLVDARRLALSRNPELRARRQFVGMARGRLRQARVFRFNPEFLLESEQVGKGRTLDAYEGEVAQEFEWAGQRGLRIRTARIDVARTEHATRDAERLTAAAAAAAFYRSVAAERRVELAQKMLTLNEELLSAVSDLLESGAISVLEANLARIESGRARARVLEERRDARSAMLALRRTLGLRDDQPLRLSHDVPAAPDPATMELASLVERALARRPDLHAAASDVELSRSRMKLAGREAIPNLRLSMPFDRLNGPGSRQIGIGVGLSIPLWNRNQGTVDALRADVRRAEYGRQAAELAIRAEVADALQRYASASAEESFAETALLQPARTNQALLAEAFSAGTIDLPTLLLVRNELLDVELDYWNSWLERRLELVRLEAVTAEPLPKP